MNIPYSIIESTGQTTFAKGMPVGGLFGKHRENSGGDDYPIIDCYVRLSFIGGTQFATGGIIGDADVSPAVITNVYALIDTMLSPRTGSATDADGYIGRNNYSSLLNPKQKS